MKLYTRKKNRAEKEIFEYFVKLPLLMFFSIALIEIHLSLCTVVTYLISSLVCRCHEIFTPHLLMIRRWSEKLGETKREESWCVCSLCTILCFLYIFIFSKTKIYCMKTEKHDHEKKMKLLYAVEQINKESLCTFLSRDSIDLWFSLLWNKILNRNNPSNYYAKKSPPTTFTPQDVQLV